MLLLTKELKKKLPALYATEAIPLKDKIVVVHFFHILSGWDWYAIEAGEEDGEYLFWGYVRGFEGEWGYFSLSELEAITGLLKVERDLGWKPTPCSDITKIIIY